MSVIATYYTPDEAQLAAARLRSAGIEASVRDENTITMYWLYSNALGGVRIEVPDADHADALKILGERPPEDGMILCPRCGSANAHVHPLNRSAALLTMVNLPLPIGEMVANCQDCGAEFKVGV